MGTRIKTATRDTLVSELRDRLTRTSSPRLTILIVLALAGGAAFLTSFAGLSAGVDSMAVRYAIATSAGYLAFVLLIRGWIAIRRGWQPDDVVVDAGIPNPFDVLDVTDLAGRGVGRGAQALKSFAGGRSGGGGGGSAWIAEPVERAVSVRAVPGSSSAASDAVESVGSSLDLDDGIWIVIAIAAALGGVVCIAYVIYIAPLLLAEVALDAALVSAAYRRLRTEDVGHWTGAVFRRTWVPAVILVVFMSLTGFAAQQLAPEARSIGGVIRALVS